MVRVVVPAAVAVDVSRVKLAIAAGAVVAAVPPLARGSVPVTPVVSGKPVQLVNVPEEGVPSAGVTSVGDVANTLAPVPVIVSNEEYS